jgi:tRNA threonylcarbamoyladenosine biosynthesis protein TsaB
MLVIALDTCLDACSAAVGRVVPGGVGGPEVEILAERFEAMATGHAERLMPMVAAVLAEAGVAAANVGRIAVTAGPGSFTGVRVGLAAAEGLALATGAPIVATTSLHVMARHAVRRARSIGGRSADQSVEVAIAVATRDGLVYLQAFEGTTPRPRGEAALVTPAEGARAIQARPILLAGSGAQALTSTLPALQPDWQVLNEPLAAQAHDLIALAPTLAAGPVRALYLRPPDAKPVDAALPLQD